MLSDGMQQQKDMIPLIFEQGYQAKGWLGLILGTRMYYRFFPSAVGTDAAFVEQMDAVAREIGDRGKAKALSEAVPPATMRASAPAAAPAPALARAPARAPAPAPASTLAPAPAPAPAPQTPQPSVLSFTPSMQSSPAQVVVRQEVAPAAAVSSESSSAGTFSEMVSFMREEREMMVSAMEKQRHEMQALVEQERSEKETQLEQIQQRMTLAHVHELAVSDEDLATLQARLDGLHAAQLMTDEELYACEGESLSAAHRPDRHYA